MAVGSKGVGEQVCVKQELIASYGVKSGYKATQTSLVRSAMRKYTTAQSSIGKDTKKWNIELNRLYKLRYFEDVTSAYAKMKESGAAPDATTYMIVFDSHIANYDNNAVVSLVAEAKAAGVKTSFLDKEAQLQQMVFSPDDSAELELKSIQLHQSLKKFRQAGLNPFDPAH